MTRSLPAICILALLPPFVAAAQPATESARTREFLSEPVETGGLRDEMPLAKFLAALEQRLPKDKRVALRIDREAFGKKADDVAASPVALPPVPTRMSVLTALRLALSQVKTPVDYRLGPNEFVITTPERAVYSARYDIRDLVMRPGRGGTAVVDTERAKSVVKEILRGPARDDRPSLEVLNGTRLVVRGNAARHGEVSDVIAALRRLDDLAVIVRARLYEVDNAFYRKLNSAKRVPLDDLERQFLEGKLPRDSLFTALEKETPVLVGEELRVGNGQDALLLARQWATSFRPNPDRVLDGDVTRQLVLDGIALRGQPRVSADRRSVRLQLTEQTRRLDEIQTAKVWDLKAGKEVTAELPRLRKRRTPGRATFRTAARCSSRFTPGRPWPRGGAGS
jgi:hypothetical protein